MQLSPEVRTAGSVLAVPPYAPDIAANRVVLITITALTVVPLPLYILTCLFDLVRPRLRSDRGTTKIFRRVEQRSHCSVPGKLLACVKPWLVVLLLCKQFQVYVNVEKDTEVIWFGWEVR